jgi:hypothetical protein
MECFFFWKEKQSIHSILGYFIQEESAEYHSTKMPVFHIPPGLIFGSMKHSTAGPSPTNDICVWKGHSQEGMTPWISTFWFPSFFQSETLVRVLIRRFLCSRSFTGVCKEECISTASPISCPVEQCWRSVSTISLCPTSVLSELSEKRTCWHTKKS